MIDDKMKNQLPLHVCKILQPQATINKLHTVFHTIIILSLLSYRASLLLFHHQSFTTPTHFLAWLLISASEFLLSFLWFLGQAYRWRPVTRTIFPERLPADEELPPIDIFICTADPTKEPTMEVMNTVLSAMSLDYPPEKLSIYLSDDAGSQITLFSIKEAFIFAKFWIPFCKKYGVETRCPKAYLSASGTDDFSFRCNEFMVDKENIKVNSNLSLSYCFSNSYGLFSLWIMHP